MIESIKDLILLFSSKYDGPPLKFEHLRSVVSRLVLKNNPDKVPLQTPLYLVQY